MGPGDKDRLDDLLDGALKRYGEVEPRVGLEGRVLASLAAVNSKRAHGSWAWALAGISACVLVFGIWLAYRGEIKPTTIVSNRPVQDVTVPAIPVAPSEQQASQTRQSGSRRRSESAIVMTAEEPKLKQFPSPLPISTQEVMLLEYVQQYPQEAMLISRQQNEFQLKVEQAEAESAKTVGSDQQER